MNIEQHPFEPFLPENAKILFLGSFPPQPHRWCMPFYYPNWINDFWRIIGLIHFNDKDRLCIIKEKRFNEQAIKDFCTQNGLAFYDTSPLYHHSHHRPKSHRSHRQHLQLPHPAHRKQNQHKHSNQSKQHRPPHRLLPHALHLTRLPALPGEKSRCISDIILIINILTNTTTMDLKMDCPALENYVPKNKQIKFCLFSEARWLRLLSGQGKPYEHIIEGFIQIAEYWYSDICEARERELTIKWIAERLNETPQNINKWLPLIYKDLFELNYSKPQLFASEGEILCTFLFSGFEYGRTCSFSFGLPAVPHSGDTLIFEFVKAALDCDYFYIKEITFARDCGNPSITIHTKPKELFERINRYREFLLEKARFMNQIDYETESKSHYYLDEMLRYYENKGYVPSVETIKQEREELYKFWREHNKK